MKDKLKPKMITSTPFAAGCFMCNPLYLLKIKPYLQIVTAKILSADKLMIKDQYADLLHGLSNQLKYIIKYDLIFTRD